uniref:hypothetical protein n=1 Tax=Yoonia sp. TaxID=2212373 RepID=UPI004047D14F
MFKKYYKKSVPYSRRVYKATGLKNPIKKGKVSTSRIIHDVKLLKNLINAEKKRLEVGTAVTTTVGQLNLNGSGHSLFEMTPNLSQGITNSSRIGNSVKWTGSMIRFQFQQQSATSQPRVVKIFMFQVIGKPYSTVSNAIEFLDPNKFLSNLNSSAVIYDNNSLRNQDNFKTFKLIRVKKVYVPADEINGVEMIRNVDMPIKLKEHHLKWNDNGELTKGQVICLIVADGGNINSSNSTLTGVPQQNGSTGIKYFYTMDHYYIDN